MPQMAPISWLTLFLIFSITLIMFNALNYFSFTPLMKKTSSKMMYKITSMNWKW